MISPKIINLYEHRNNLAHKELHSETEKNDMSTELQDAIQQLIQQLRTNQPLKEC